MFKIANTNTKNEGKFKSFLNEFKKNKTLFFMLLPGLFILLINNYLPMPGILLAFKDYNYRDGFFKSKWCGFQNFKYLFASGKALIVTRNTIGYNLTFIIISITIPVFIAIVLNEIANKKLAKLYQSIFFIPYFLSWVVVSYLVFTFLSADMGVLNQWLTSMGKPVHNWYAEPKHWYGILTFVNTWKWAGYDTIIYLASLCGFEKTYYEAAAVDGATRFQQIMKITIPMLKPVIIILTLLKLGRIFYSDFGLFYIVTKNSGPLNKATEVLDTYVYRALRETGDIGMASAAGFYQAVVGFVVVYVSNYFVKKIDKDSALF